MGTFLRGVAFQYRDYKTSYDFKERIRNRKQRTGEIFDEFLDAVSSIMDRLPSSIHECELIEILTRNLRPEIRQEI